ncbi:hypothetical protein BJF83_04185 [Nocardiopsis sp. CNR-923]|uniref:hypothetical protein n=1 Tax=Nocardiopsis sp. CNR-923 TaxID=1904965 RepID=UPI0009692F50|nr:hypothetical protein [Nocardiopsis sp. CNR-923]OLT26073.1 hypothetical protein BJF83_04185 [Nocardiopsis sp. CNR-923]
MQTWTRKAARQLLRNDIVLVEAGHLRVVTAVEPDPEPGFVNLRLGTAWYRYPAGKLVVVDGARR